MSHKSTDLTLLIVLFNRTVSAIKQDLVLMIKCSCFIYIYIRQGKISQGKSAPNRKPQEGHGD